MEVPIKICFDVQILKLLASWDKLEVEILTFFLKTISTLILTLISMLVCNGYFDVKAYCQNSTLIGEDLLLVEIM